MTPAELLEQLLGQRCARRSCQRQIESIIPIQELSHLLFKELAAFHSETLGDGGQLERFVGNRNECSIDGMFRNGLDHFHADSIRHCKPPGT